MNQLSSQWTTPRLALVAVLGAINGVTTTPLALVWTALNNSVGIIGASAYQPFVIFMTMAAWLVPIRGTFLIAGTISGLANFLSGDPNGVVTLYWGIAGGVAGEVAMAAFGYSFRRRTAIVILAALLYIPATNIATFFVFGWVVNTEFFIGIVVALIAITVEGALPGIALSKWLTRTGLLRTSPVMLDPAEQPAVARSAV